MNAPSSLVKIIVSPDGRGTHRTITEAISSASPGETIEIRSGVYEEVLVLDRPVKLLGDPDGFVVIHHPKYTPIKVRQTEVALENLALGVGGVQDSLEADKALLCFTKCLVAPTSELIGWKASITSALSEMQGGSARWSNDVSRKGGPKAIAVKNGTSLTMLKSVLANVTVSAVSSQLKVDRCVLLRSELNVGTEAMLVCTETRFDCGDLSGTVNIQERSQAILSGLQFDAIKWTAIVCDNSKLDVTGCAFQGTSAQYSCGVYANMQSCAALRHVKIHNCKTGINGGNQGSLQIEDSLITGADFGILVCDQSGDYRLGIQRTKLDNNREGVVLTALTPLNNYAIIEDCEVCGNEVGLSVSGWGGRVWRCNFERNSTSNISATPFFLLKSVQDCKGFGESTPFKIAQAVRRWLPF